MKVQLDLSKLLGYRAAAAGARMSGKLGTKGEGKLGNKGGEKVGAKGGNDRPAVA